MTISRRGIGARNASAWAVLVALALLAAACGDDDTGASAVGEEPTAAVQDAEPTVEAEPDSTTAPEPTQTPEPTATPAPEPLTGTLVESLVEGELHEPPAVEAGDYRTELFSRELGFTTAQPFVFLFATPREVAIAPPDFGESFRDIVFIEPSRFADPAVVGVASGSPAAYVEVPGDLGAWFEAAAAVEVTDSGEGTLGGVPGRWWQIELAADAGTHGAALWEGEPHARWSLVSGITQRIWQLEDQPVLVVVAAQSELIDDWVPEADTLLSTLRFGDPTALADAAISDPTSGEHEVGRTRIELVDTSRGTDEVSQGGEVVVPAADQRTIAVTLAYPAEVRGLDSEAVSGPFPLVVVAHGLGGTDTIDAHEEALVTNGTVVAAVRFPESSDPGRSVPDFVEQPADVSFVLDELLAGNVPDHLAGVIDPERIGVMGYSLGGATVYGLIGSACCADERIGAAVSHAGIVLGFEGGNDWANPPTLIIAGRDDTTTRLSTLQDLIEEMAAPTALLDLAGEGHITWSHPVSPNFEPLVDLLRAFFEVQDPGQIEVLVEPFDAEWTVTG